MRTRRYWSRTCVAASAALLVWALSAVPTNYYAQPGGGGAASCVDAAANVCTLARAISVALDGDIINLASGTYVGTELGVSGYALISGKMVNLLCATAGSCILRTTTTTGAIRVTGLTGTTSGVWDGLVVDGVNGTTPNFCFWAQASSGGKYALTISNSTCLDPVFYAVQFDGVSLDLTLTNDTLTSSTAVGSRSFLYGGTTWATGSVTVTGGSGTIAKTSTNGGSFASPLGMINVVAAGSGVTAIVSGFTGNATYDPAATGNGEYGGIMLYNIPDAQIINSTMNVYGAPSTRTAVLFRIASSIASTAANGAIRNVTGTNGTNGGYGAQIGSDGSTAGDNFTNSGTIESANITCTYQGNSAHGLMQGSNQGGRVIKSVVNGCGINFIAKLTSGTPTLFQGDISINANSQHFRAKGALAIWNNTTTISTSGVGNLYYADDDPTIPTHSTVSVYNNLGYVNGGAPTYNVFIGPSNTLTAADTNDWFGAASWYNAGAAYTTLATWNADAAVGTDLAVDPKFAGASRMVAASDFKSAGDFIPNSTTLARAGRQQLAGGLMFNGEAIDFPPTPGAMRGASPLATMTTTNYAH